LIFISTSPHLAALVVPDRTGQNQYFGWQSENQSSTTDYMLANDEVLEIEGVEIIGPNTGGVRNKIKDLRLIIDGKENENITFNELNAPALIPGARGMSDMFRDGSQCINLGRGILAPGGLARGTAPWSCCPKVGPGEKLGIEVNMTPTAEGGVSTVSGNMRVRVHYCKIKGENKLLEVLARNGFLDNANGVVQEFDVGDTETSEIMPMQTVTKRVPETGAFKIEDWTRLLGGNDVDKPYVENFVQYAQNAAATTTNEWFEFTQEGNRVVSAEQHLKWSPSKFEAYQLKHVAVGVHTNQKYLRFLQGGRAFDTTYRIDPLINMIMFPQSPGISDQSQVGPYELPKSVWAWNENLSVQIKDNGTSIPAWASGVSGAMVGIWGYHYKLRGA